MGHYVIPSDVIRRVKMISQGLISLFTIKNGVDYNRRLLIALKIVKEDLEILINQIEENEK